MQRKWTFFVAFLLFQSDANSARLSEQPKIKVKIASDLGKVSLRGLDLKRKLIGDKKFKVFSGFKTVNFDCTSLKKARLKTINKPILLASLDSATGFVNWGTKKFRGKMKVLSGDDWKTCDLINETEIEHYLSTLLSKEMNADWPVEALKAQAIAARTYALYKIEKPKTVDEGGDLYDIESSEKHQVSGSFFDESLSTFKATKDTHGMVLVNPKSELKPIFFHSKCGGETLTPEMVWSNKLDGYEGRKCPFCRPYGRPDWNNAISMKKFKQVFQKILVENNKSANSTVRLAPDNFESKNFVFYLGEERNVLSKKYFRRFLGRKVVPSMNFMLSKEKGKVKFSGKGNGHGVGLCQWGAYGMALKGKNYKQILKHYFPKHKLKRVY